MMVVYALLTMLAAWSLWQAWKWATADAPEKPRKSEPPRRNWPYDWRNDFADDAMEGVLSVRPIQRERRQDES